MHLEIMWTMSNVFDFAEQVKDFGTIETKEFSESCNKVLFKNVEHMHPAQFKRVIGMLEGRDNEKTGFVLKFLDTLQSGSYDIKRLDFA